MASGGGLEGQKGRTGVAESARRGTRSKIRSPSRPGVGAVTTTGRAARVRRRGPTAEGLSGFRVDRPIANLLLDTVGLPVIPGKSAAETMWASDPPPEPEATEARSRFMADPRDTASANGVAALLERIETGRLLKPATRSFLLDTMALTRTGADRLKGALPKEARIEHKTGTLATVANGPVDLDLVRAGNEAVLRARDADAAFLHPALRPPLIASQGRPARRVADGPQKGLRRSNPRSDSSERPARRRRRSPHPRTFPPRRGATSPRR